MWTVGQGVVSEKAKVHNSMFQGKEFMNLCCLNKVPLRGAEETSNSGVSGDFATGGRGRNRKEEAYFHCFNYFYHYHALFLKNEFSLIDDRYIDRKING